MKPIVVEQFTKFSYLSDLRLSKDEKTLYFVETKCDLPGNDYKQRIEALDLTGKKQYAVTEYRKRTPYYVLKDGLLIQKVSAGIGSEFEWIRETGIEDAFTLPLAVMDIRDFDEDYWLVLAETNRRCPDYHLLSEEEREAFEKQEKGNADYTVLDEYPFVFNGAGVVNGNRNSLFLVNKKDYSCQRLTPETMQVESFDIKGKEILYSGNDFDSTMLKWSKIYQIEEDRTTEKLYDGKMQIFRTYYDKDEIMVIGTFAKEYGAMEAGKFYYLRNGEMKLALDTELSLYNTITTDVCYGKTKQFAKFHDKAYFLSCDHENGWLFRKDEKELKAITPFSGSVIDFAVSKDMYYLIAMVGQKLAEVYRYDGKELIALTHCNEHALDDCYVAEPEPLTVDKDTPIQGWVLKPIDYDPDKKYPMILDIHGGPKCAYGTVYVHEMQVWAGKGYFVVFCNPRGSDGRGNAFADLRQSYGTPDYEDIMDFVDTVLTEYPSIDEKRMGVTGGSYGGYMTNWIIGHTHRFACAASQRSISNWITEVTASDYGIDFPIEQDFADIYHCEKELWAMSPLKYANEVTTPTLFIHSLQDYRCPVWEGLQLYMVLKVRGIESKMVLFHGENHELSRSGKPQHRIRRLTEITQWMEMHLKGEN